VELFEYIDIMNQPYDIFKTDNVDSPLHWHYYSEVLYIHSGTVNICCNNKNATLTKGDLCYFYPLQLHSVSANEDNTEAVNYSVIKFNVQTLNIPKAYLQSIYNSFVHRTSEDDFCLIIHENDGVLEALVDSIVNEYESDEWMNMLAVQSNILFLLIQVARRLNLNDKVPPKPSENTLSFYHILEYIDAHCAEPLEVNELAKQCNMSYSHFARLFRENYGRSCKEYIQYIRMNKAQDLLFNSEFDLDYIAQETGFYDCSHFIRQYKKWRGITPKQERLKHAK
jgi:AraC-like DNA-binding protein